MAVFLLELVFAIIFVSAPFQLSQSQIVNRTSCPGDEYCGAVWIQYPFGLRKGCYYDSWFEVDCRRATNVSSPRPFLKRINLELQIITMSDKTARIKGPVIQRNCSAVDEVNQEDKLNFEGSPFFFSDRNNFVGVGCNTITLLAYDNKTMSGCLSTCPEETISSRDVGRCKTSFPPYLQPIFKSLENSGDEKSCSDTVNSNTAFISTSDYPSTDIGKPYVPVDLEWVLFNATRQQFEYNQTTTSCKTSAIELRINGSYQTTTTLQCQCTTVYKGNPYLQNGCYDTTCLENPTMCNKPKVTESKSIAAKIGVISAFGVLFFSVVSWYLYKLLKKRMNKKRKERFFKRNGGLLLQQKLYSRNGTVEETKLFSSKELEKATDHYNTDRTLGQGGQGTVYKGMLSDGRIVAVKKSKVIDEGRLNQFINEVVILSKINHRNVVKLLRCCLETDVPMLVYEFVPNGTLFELIHSPNKEFLLTWDVRLQIAAEVAGALYYLHSSASLPIYHRDIKSSNILLDEKYKAKVSDFGISRSVSIDQTHMTTIVQGTFGYLDPEYFRSNQFTEKSDVYSFGVVIVELLTGRKPVSSDVEESRGLAACFVDAMEENKLVEIVDPLIMMEGGWRKEMVTCVAGVAQRCLHMNGKMRPTMKEVAVELEGIRMSRRGKSTTVTPQSCQILGECESCTSSSSASDKIWSEDGSSTATETRFYSATASTFDAHPLSASL